MALKLFIFACLSADTEFVKRRRYRTLILPVLFLCAISAYSASTLFFHQQTELKLDFAPAPEMDFGQHKKNRSIASVGNKNMMIIFDCDKENQSAQIQSAVVFIKFEKCQTNLKISDYKLMNETNQYMAQIFQPTPQALSTDFIQLARGENILKFEISLNSKQKRTQTIKIERLASEIQ